MRTTNFAPLALAALLLVPAAASCAAVVAVGAGVLIGQQVLDDNVYVGQLTTDANRTWAQAKTTLSNMSLKPIEANNELRRAIADVDGAKVTVFVETYDLNRSQIRVSATKFGFSASETARVVFERITQDLDRSER
ncbi:MAG: hypothetical protein JNK02_10165 [Planctomycetes bacterium]|nr:hypothetical protein [Planctomycetota bacterium]